MSQTNDLIIQGERFAQSIRPATMTYAGNTIPCSLGNSNFYERLRTDGGGFQSVQALHIKVLRQDIPPAMLVDSANFKRGQTVTVTNTDPESPACGESFVLAIAQGNVWQPLVLQINLEKPIA